MFLGGLDSFWFWMVAMIWHLEGRCGITSFTMEFTTVGSSISGPWWCVEYEQLLHVSTRNCSSCTLWWKQLPCICIEKICQQLYILANGTKNVLACYTQGRRNHGGNGGYSPLKVPIKRYSPPKVPIKRAKSRSFCVCLIWENSHLITR